MAASGGGSGGLRGTGLSTGAKAGVGIAVVIVSVAVPFIIQAITKPSMAVTKSSPPPIVFAIAWSLLYTLAGIALTVQGFQAQTPADWAALALMLAVVVGTWGWPAVYTKSANAGTWFIVALLVLALCGVLAWRSPLAALWAPLLGWFVFALILSTQRPIGSTSSPTDPVRPEPPTHSSGPGVDIHVADTTFE